MKYLTHKHVLILSPEPWGTNFVSKHHYARELAEVGNTVYFINPPGGANTISLTSPSDCPGVTVVDYPNRLPGLNRLPPTLARLLYRQQVNAILRKIGHQPDVVWSFDPYRFQHLRVFGAQVAIYHPVDIHYTHLGHRVAESADLVLASNNAILRRLGTIATPSHFINHGLATRFLAPLPNPIPSIPQGRGKIKIGYVGNLLYRFLDADTLLSIVEQNSKIDFYFIGPYEASNLGTSLANTSHIEQLNQLQNAFVLGPRHFSEIPALINQVDGFILTYNAEEYPDELANPHKLLEYLSTGKTVVCSYIEQYQDSELVLMGRTANEISDKFSEFVNAPHLFNTPELMARRRALAEESTYPKQLSRIDAHIFALVRASKTN